MGDVNFNKTLIHSCDVQAPSLSRDGGERQLSYGTAATLECRYVPFSERWSDERRSRQVYREHHLLLRPGAAIGRKYRVSNIRLTGAGTVVDAGPFIVTEILTMGDGRSIHHVEAEMERSD